MKSHPLEPPPQEIELKLALPTSDPQGLAKRLARTPLLARRKATQLQLHNIYYDTPEQRLHQERIALRLRRVGSDAKPTWLQTLKMGGRSDSALSQRGEWEVAVPGAELARQVLDATPWSVMDPDGGVFAALSPCFVTTFERTSWSVRKQGGSIVEVSLDIGQVVAGDKRTALCELELELIAGQPAALFAVAQQIARTLAVLPLNTSKAERGYALLQDAVNLPRRAQPPALTAGMALADAARQVLREMFGQFTSNLDALRNSDDPELVHQARVGWRRLRSALQLFKPALAREAVPAWPSLGPLLTFLGELRDLDVARTETLAQFAGAYAAGNARREEKWQAMLQALTDAAKLQRKSVRYALETPAVGSTLLAITQWLEALPEQNGPGNAKTDLKVPLRSWARRRIDRLHAQLKVALKDSANPESQHRARIFSKRLRYAIEALRPLLPKRQARRWHLQATALQTSIGATRDMQQAAALVARLEADPGLAEFLRGVAVGQVSQPA
jgi:inorganic triphosphatase YgiF